MVTVRVSLFRHNRIRVSLYYELYYEHYSSTMPIYNHLFLSALPAKIPTQNHCILRQLHYPRATASLPEPNKLCHLFDILILIKISIRHTAISNATCNAEHNVMLWLLNFDDKTYIPLHNAARKMASLNSLFLMTIAFA